LPVAVVAFVDLPAGDAADHRAHRRGRIARGAATDLAAEYRADHTTDHRGDAAPGVGATAIAAVVIVVATGIVAVGVAAVAIIAVIAISAVVACVIAVLARITTRLLYRIDVAAIRIAIVRHDHRVDPDHARIVVLGITVVAIGIDFGLRRVIVLRVIPRRLRGSRADHCSGEAQGKHRSGEAVHGELQAPEWRDAHARARAVTHG